MLCIATAIRVECSASVLDLFHRRVCSGLFPFAYRIADTAGDARRTVPHRDPAGRSRRPPAATGAGALVTGSRQRRLALRHGRWVPARARRALAQWLRLACPGASDERAAAVP